MLDRDQYPAGVPCWVDTEQSDPRAAVAFYSGLFGWEFDDRMPADTEGHYFVGKLRGRAVAGVVPLAEEKSKPSWNTYISVASADESAAKASDAGGTVVREPSNLLDLGRTAVIADRSGATFSVWQAMGHNGAQLVNEPGTWNFSELNTRDPEGAKAFYGLMFGWEISSFGGDAGDSGFWRMPGYGDFLAQRDPEVRERQADVGAPEGFEDAVAWLVPMTSDQFTEDTPPHWSITFAVDDADAVADRASKLGGKVLAPPMDAPWVRMTVLSDPQGAVFTASKFTPPA
jgi:uncharacterized protein